MDHTELIECLIRKGVSGKFLRLLISIYSSLCSCVRLNNQDRTEYFSCNIGTRQGCKLSPILLGSDSVITLQSLINMTSGFCLRKKMQVNLSKTKIIVFRSGGFLRNYEKWYFRGQPIEVVSAYISTWV